MLWRWALWPLVWLPVSALALACGGDDDGAVARFELAGDEFYALPFPSDLRRDDDGTVDLSEHPRPNELTADYIDAIDEAVDGFSLSPVAFFRFTAPIDPDSLPADAHASLEADSSVFLIDVDPDSPERGRRFPVNLRFDEAPGSVIGENWLAVQTFPGFVLREQNTYAVVLTRGLSADGAPVTRDDDFRELASGAGDPEVTAVYQPLWDTLAQESFNPDEVVNAAVFTTQNVTGLLAAAREVVRAGPAPVPRDIQAGAESTFAAYTGLYDAPNFQQGDPPYRREGGAIITDDGGLPIVQRSEELRFALTVPLEEVPADGWPVVIYSHGTGGDYQSFIRSGVAAQLAGQGIAVISMDQVLHGPRDPTGGSAELNFFNFLNPSSARDNTLQGAIDAMSQLRLVEAFDYVDDEAGRQIHFDTQSIMFYGHSQGGITGIPFLGVEPLVQGAVLSGSGGLIYLGLLLKTEPIDITALISTVIRDEPLDEFNPVLALLQTYLDRADGINYARYITREPPDGFAAKSVLLGEGFTDRYTPIPSIEALALALGTDLVAPQVSPIRGFDLAGLEVVSAPVQANLAGTTAAVVQYEEEPGSDGHFIFFDIPAAKEQASGFLRSIVDDGIGTVPAVP